jgi:hypothetical protein
MLIRRLLQTFLDIALWRKGPQDLPASGLLLMMVLVAYVVVGFCTVRLLALDERSAAVFISVDALMLCGWLWVVLAFFGRRQRFVQTITATFGVGLLVLLLVMAVRAMQLLIGPGNAFAGNWLLLRFLISALVLGRIFMLALDRGLLTGIALTVAIVYSTAEVVQLALDRLG